MNMNNESREPAPNQDPFGYVRDWARLREERGWWHSFELPDGSVIEGVSSLADLKHRLAQWPIPEDLRGKRVLDIGAWDGWFSFEMERRGAEVVAIDCWDNPRFRQMREALGSRVDYRVLDVYEATPERLGKFDLVLFLAVLYHLKHPLLGLERVCALTEGMAAVESFVLREEHRPGEQAESRAVMEFYESDEMGGEPDNWYGPSLPCLLALCRTAGFARAELRAVLSQGASVACYRSWEPLLPEPSAAAPVLLTAFQARNYGVNFRSRADEYVSGWFECDAGALGRDHVKPEAGGYGVRPLYVGRIEGNRWQVNFRLPPGLAPGWHEVRVRTGSSGWSNPRRIAVDVPLEAAAPVEVVRVCDAGEGFLSVWVAGLPANADVANTGIFVDGARAAVTHFDQDKGGTPRQINIRVPADARAERAKVTVRLSR